MKWLLLYSLLLIGFLCKAQDKVYFLDGTSKPGKVTEIGPENIVLETTDATEMLSRENILLIEFKNGSIEVINTPTETRIYNPSSAGAHAAPSSQSIETYNLFSVNTLALCNADISGFYERMLPGKRLGLGIMGAYNFNVYASFSNLFIAVLHNARKKYDLGVYANIYSGGLKNDRTTFYYGILFKYMSFNFSSVTEEKVTVGNTVSTNITYHPAQGSQLATLITFGTHTNLNKNFFFRSLMGLGGFNLHGDYKQQYNYFLNKANQASNTPNATAYNRSFLLKFYAGINLGFNF